MGSLFLTCICFEFWLQFELQYLHDYAGVNASIGLTANPVVNLSSAFGTKAFALGADVSLDTASGNFTKYNAGLSFTNEDLIASLNLSVFKRT
jgi:voltage-dependent anion channel protein 2